MRDLACLRNDDANRLPSSWRRSTAQIDVRVQGAQRSGIEILSRQRRILSAGPRSIANENQRRRSCCQDCLKNPLQTPQPIEGKKYDGVFMAIYARTPRKAALKPPARSMLAERAQTPRVGCRIETLHTNGDATGD
jgi:hypothetical protein